MSPLIKFNNFLTLAQGLTLKQKEQGKCATLNISCSFRSSFNQKDEWMMARNRHISGKQLLAKAATLSEKSQHPIPSDQYISILKGHWKQNMIQPNIVRVFISSTFTNTKAERDFLMRDVYPFMQELCKMLGLEFETVDMCWGVRESTTKSHNTSILCMKEIKKCLAMSLGPTFICLIGNKYGYRPFLHLLKSTPWTPCGPTFVGIMSHPLPSSKKT